MARYMQNLPRVFTWRRRLAPPDVTGIAWKLALVLALPLWAQRAPAQTLYDAGLLMAAAAIEDGIAVTVGIVNDAQHCDFSEELLKAEAERALRRDGITTRLRSSTVLAIRVVMVSLSSGGCAAFVATDLMVALNVETMAFLPAADSGRLLTHTAPEHVGLIRDVVEEHVSVIANAIRRAEGELPDR